MPQDAPPQDLAPDTPSKDGNLPPSSDDTPSPEVLEIERLTALVSEQETELSGLREQVKSTVDRYREALIAGAPDLPEELIQGGTIEELDRSMESARKIVEKVASRIETRAPESRVPSGAPPRRPVDLSGLTAREKIMYAINKS